MLLDLAYVIAAVLTSPIWLVRMIRSGKIRTDWSARFGRVSLPTPEGERCVVIHAVSVGEVNAIRLLVERLDAALPDHSIVVATTTDTGFARAYDVFGTRHRVVRYPFDATFAVRRFLDAIRPDAVALVELEVWPNFTKACATRDIPVVVVNGRLSARSHRGYERIRALVRPSFARLAAAAVQDDAYADRFVSLGADRDVVTVTGTMKWDTAGIADAVDGADELAEAMGIDRSRPLVVAGSTAPEEHALLRDALPDDAQLLCAPRRPEWFDEAAATLEGCTRRSTGTRNDGTRLFLLDTIGELRAAYALADVVLIGRSFGERHGSDMMEPIALGKPTIVGPAHGDFQTTVDALVEGGGIVVTTKERLRADLARLLSSPDERAALASAGRDVIRAHQGATDRTVEIVRGVVA